MDAFVHAIPVGGLNDHEIRFGERLGRHDDGRRIVPQIAGKNNGLPLCRHAYRCRAEDVPCIVEFHREGANGHRLVVRHAMPQTHRTVYLLWREERGQSMVLRFLPHHMLGIQEEQL